jgi:lipopolysaccharide/colanic/teichoic acid biosynthesis glycosyltransferase
VAGSRRRQQLRIKRFLDIVVSAGALVALSPLLLATAVVLLATQGRPVLFRQQRPGRDGLPFTIVKFRTMRAPHRGEIAYRTDEQRVTAIGRILRATSIDELPELWNVLRGDMSLVGPRPLLMEYLDAYTPRQRHRHDMRPGVTSWAIVHGRHVLRFDERVDLDVWYVEHWSFRLDARIIAMTVEQLIRRTHVATIQDPEEIGFPLPDVVSTQSPEDVTARDAGTLRR